VRFWGWLVAVSLVAWVVTTGVASADSAMRVVGGAASEHQRAAVRTGVERATREAGWPADEPTIAKKDRDALLRCMDIASPWSCVPAGIKAAGVRRVLVVRADTKQDGAGAPVIVLVATLLVSDPEAAVRQRFCEHCADDRLSDEAAELARQMLREVAVQGGRTIVVIRSEPQAAQIFLDGEPIGATNTSYNTFPGKHVVLIEKPGYHAETREFSAEDGKTTTVAVTLRPTAHDVPIVDDPPRRESRALPYIVIGAGVAAVVAGGVLQATKDGPPLLEDQPSRLYSAPGISLMAGGAAIVGVGLVLWMRGSSPPASPAPASGPTASVSSESAWLGWAGRF
jgi:hypothetical protein